MRHSRLLLAALALSSVAFVACGDDMTQPNSVAEPNPITAPAITHDSWLVRRDMPFERFELSTAMVPNAAGQSILYAIGGANSVGVPLGRVQAYNAATDTWTWKKDMPIALRDMNEAAVIGGKIYVSGGVSTSAWWKGYLPILLVYDPATNTWVRKRDMPEGGARGATGVINGKLYVITSNQDGPSLFFRYNPVTDRWIRLPSPKGNYNKGGVLYSRFYVVGGDLEMYDPASNQWTTKTKPPSDVYGAAVSMGAKLYLIGQNTSWVPGSVSDFGNYVYDPGTNTWSSKTPPPRLFDFSASRVFVNGQPRIEVVGRSYSEPNNVQYVP
jgi:N-acetylneuraminic acid mutarotase